MIMGLTIARLEALSSNPILSRWCTMSLELRI